jgi:hypothetical protein
MNKHERSMLVWPPRSGETNRLYSTDQMADGIKYGLHDGKKSKTKSCTRSRRRVAANKRSLHAGFVSLVTKPTPS